MPRYKMVNGERIQFTAAEETARDAEEAAWESGAFDRAMADLRQRRNALLAATDFNALSDVTMSADVNWILSPFTILYLAIFFLLFVVVVY